VEQLNAARPRLTYTLDQAVWMHFAIPPGATSLRVTTNANLPADLADEPEAEWLYGVIYELLDASGHVQTQHVYHHRSRVTRQMDQDTHEASLAAFYLDTQLKPTDTRNLIVDLAEFPSATRIRVRLALKQESIVDVAMSLYARQPVSERQASYLWRRLPRAQQLSLTKGLVYSTDFLNQSEQHQLLQNRWQALGPKGIEGRDYDSRKLYVLETIEPENTSEPILPSGLIVDAEHDGMIPIPADGITLRLDFLPQSASHPPPDQNGIHLTWYGKQPHERWHHHVTWQDTGTRFEGTLSPGLLELKVLEGATVVQSFRRDANQYTPWVLEPLQSHMYLVKPGQSIDFAVVHAKHMPTPFRIDVRHLPYPSQPGNTSPPAVNYELLNTAGEAVQAGHLVSEAVMSRYDRIPSLSPETSVSDPSTTFFAIPSQVTHIRFSLPFPSPAAPMLIAAWNRPPDLVRELYIGHDGNLGDHGETGGDGHATELEEQRQWAWFPKRPENVEHLVAEQHAYLLHVQPRPPQDEADLQTDEYQVERYRPEGMWHGRYLFLPRDPDQTPLRPEALAVAFQPLPSGKAQRLVLGGLPQLRFLQPTLMYFSKTAKPQPFEVIIDGVQEHHGTTTGWQGEIELPVVSAGAHQIKLKSQPETQWYMNHVVSGTPSHVKRLAYRFDSSGLSFIYERQHATEETLSMRWHAPYGTRQATYIQAHLALSSTSRLTPASSWTFHERRYVLAPTTGPPLPVLNTTATHVNGGQPFFLPIGPDVPAGRYRIRLRLEQGPPGYITLGKLNRGVFESRQFTGEKVPQYAQTQP
jgi:hypothetical protein